MEGGLDAGSSAIRDASAVRAVAVTISLSGAAGSARVTRSVGAASLERGRTCLRRSQGGLLGDRSRPSSRKPCRQRAAGATVVTSLPGTFLKADGITAQTLVTGTGVTAGGVASWRDAATGILDADAFRLGVAAAGQISPAASGASKNCHTTTGNKVTPFRRRK